MFNKKIVIAGIILFIALLLNLILAPYIEIMIGKTDYGVNDFKYAIDLTLLQLFKATTLSAFPIIMLFYFKEEKSIFWFSIFFLITNFAFAFRMFFAVYFPWDAIETRHLTTFNVGFVTLNFILAASMILRDQYTRLITRFYIWFALANLIYDSWFQYEVDKYIYLFFGPFERDLEPAYLVYEIIHILVLIGFFITELFVINSMYFHQLAMKRRFENRSNDIDYNFTEINVFKNKKD